MSAAPEHAAAHCSYRRIGDCGGAGTFIDDVVDCDISEPTMSETPRRPREALGSVQMDGRDMMAAAAAIAVVSGVAVLAVSERARRFFFAGWWGVGKAPVYWLMDTPRSSMLQFAYARRASNPGRPGCSRRPASA